MPMLALMTTTRKIYSLYDEKMPRSYSLKLLVKTWVALGRVFFKRKIA